MALIKSTAIPSGATDYELEQSLKFEDGRSTYLSRTPAADGNRKTWTLSYWIKRSGVADHKSHFGGSLSGSASVGVQIQFDGGLQQLLITDYRAGYNVDWSAKSNMAFRDLSGWYHIIIAVDTTQSTASNRVKLYANGELLSLTTYNAPSQNFDTKFNQNSIQVIGAATDNLTPTNFYEGYMSEVNFLDGVVATPADFGETGTYGEWKPIEYSGTYGTNGFYLPFKNDYTVEGFSTVTYKGTAANHYIGGVGFSPDFIWTKSRSTAGKQHILVDKIRGGDKNLMSDSTEAENSAANRKLTLGAADGYVIDSNSGHLNESDKTYVSWNWDMGADTPTGFGCVLYTGSGVNRDIGNVGFQPDLVWVRERETSSNNYLIDSVRGANNVLYSDLTNAEQDASGPGTTVTKFNPDGFGLGTSGGVNQSGNTNVAWCWDMGNTTVANTNGTINSQVRANPTYGQSVVTYTGTGSNATIGHGLSSAPEVVIVKDRSNANSWQVFHTSLGNTAAAFLDLTAAVDTGETSYWNNTSPTNSLVSLGTNTKVNHSGHTYVAYAFNSVSGYSKFGSYSGTGSSGNSITTGFRPAFLLVKNANRAENWAIVDSTRSPTNPATKALFSNSSEVEQDNAVNAVDFNSNNFTVDSTDDRWNRSGDTYIYMAFAGGMDSISDYNTDGSIDSRVKANPTYGQSVVSYSGNGSDGATVGHGLSSAPDMVIVKDRDGTPSWSVGHVGLGTNEVLLLNQSSAKANCTTDFSNGGVGARGSSHFTLEAGTVDANNVNTNNNKYIAYCFHSVTGYSKFGSYTGNGSANHAITGLGFKPAFLLIKRTNSAHDWVITDNTRNPNEPLTLLANTSDAESNQDGDDVTSLDSDGFTLGVNARTNGNNDTFIYAAFADKREYAYWLDQSGNNNDWTSNNLTESDISVDSPTNNFATFNPLAYPTTHTTLSEGNLSVKDNGGDWSQAYVTQARNSGKVYVEFMMGNAGGMFFGITTETTANNPAISFNNYYVGSQANDFGFRINDYGSGSSNNEGYSTGGSFTSLGTAQPVAGDIYQLAFDLDNAKVYFGKNNTWFNSANPSSGSNGISISATENYFVTVSIQNQNTNAMVLNAGQDSSFAGNKTAQGNQDGNDIGDFYYTPPTGFLALCTKNLPDATVTPSEHFNTVLYTGNGGTNVITGVGFQSDWTWIKQRSNADSNVVFDAVRGVHKRLVTDSSAAEADWTSVDKGLDVFSSDGFTVKDDSSGNYSVNKNSGTFVAWNWKANGSGSSNTDGSITSTVSANVDAGFSIVSWTGSGSAGTIGHGLNSTPEMIITFARSNGDSHRTYHSGLTDPTEDYLKLDTTDAEIDGSFTTWNSTAPTSSVFSVWYDNSNNGSGRTYVGYCFHSVDGYSKVGSYTGNGNADGTFVYTGFRPAFVMMKDTVNANSWVIIDSERDTYNQSLKRLYADSSEAEYTATDDTIIDIVSNGFKHRYAGGNANQSNDTVIYIAFAETPFKYSNAR